MNLGKTLLAPDQSSERRQSRRQRARDVISGFDLPATSMNLFTPHNHELHRSVIHLSQRYSVHLDSAPDHYCIPQDCLDSFLLFSGILLHQQDGSEACAYGSVGQCKSHTFLIETSLCLHGVVLRLQARRSLMFLLSCHCGLLHANTNTFTVP